MLLTAPAGTYTFDWDDSDNGLTITYPVTAHPSTNYVYMEKYDNWNSGTHCYMHYWYTSGSDVPLTSGDKDLKMTAHTTIGGTNYYLFPKLIDYPKFKAAQGRNGDGGGENRNTDNMDATGHGGQLVYWKDASDGWTWGTFTVRIQLNDLSATTAVNPTYMDVAFNSDVLSDLTSVPQKSYYDFGGFCVNSDGTGTKVIGEDGKWIKSVPEYTTADTVWIHEGTSTTFYAQWIEKKHTVTIAYKYGETSIRANGSVANVGVETAQDATAPFITGYVFTGWTLVDGVTTASELSGSTISIHATADSKTITANYVVRYGLVGSLKADGEPSEGMPGWPTKCSICGSDFAYNAESSNYTLTVNLTKPNATYKFRIVDRTSNIWCGAHQDNVYVAENTSKTLKAANGYNDAEMGTAGRGNYTFTVTEVTDDGVWPQVTISNPVSRLVTLGHKSVTVEGNEGVIGTIVAKDAANNEYTSGQYIANGETVTIVTTCPDDYKLEGLYSNSSYSGGTIYSSWTVIEAVNAYAKFVETTNTFEGDVESHETEWNNTDNWSAGHLPTINEVAIIQKPVVVDITDAKAKRVLLMQNGGHTGSIDIPAGKELVVRTTIRKTTDGSTYGATGENDIIIGSTLLAGNGALVMGANDGTNKATVYFATKAKTVEQAGVKHNVNQFIGTPFNDQGAILYNYYGTKIYRFMAAHDGNLGPENEWKRVQSNEGMNGFFGYNILTNQTTEAFLEMTGTLCKSEVHSVGGHYETKWDSTENMFANSWVAPIYIPNFDDDDFTNMERTIYIFNAGTPADQGSHSTEDGSANNESPGQYVVLPIHASPWVGMNVIPSMQAFSVFATGASPSLKFNYTRLVYNPALATGEDHAGIVPNRAPQRTNDEDAPTVLRLAVTGESGYAAKIVLLERTDFSDNFDDGWDGRFMAGDDAAPQLYAVTPDGNMAINSIPNIEGTLLGFKAGEADDVFTFSFDYDGEALYLYDTHLQIYTRVMTGNTYAFTTTDNEAHNRFILTHNAPGVATGIEPVNNPSQVNNKMIIDNHLYIFRGGVLYDALGRMIGNGKEAGL